jgi:hypothetical protein
MNANRFRERGPVDEDRDVVDAYSDEEDVDTTPL